VTAVAASSVVQVVVDVDGQPMAREQAATLSHVVVHQALSEPAQCELTFTSSSASESLPSLLPGAALRLSIVGSEPALFAGDVTVVEHVYEPDLGHALRVRAYDRLHRLRKRQTLRAMLELTPHQLAAELARDAGLVVVSQREGPRWPRVVQTRQSDLRLLVEVTEACGLYPVVRGDELHLLTLEGTGPPVLLELGATLHEATLELNAEQALRRVRTLAWDPGRGEVLDAEVTSSRIGRVVDIGVDPVAVGGTGRLDLVDAGTPSDERATALAQAELDRRAADEVVLRGTASGDPRLRPGAIIDVGGVAESFRGRYVVSGAVHSVDAARGYVVELSTAAPTERDEAALGPAVVLGRVVGVEDPDGLGRIQVAFGPLGDVESSWMQVVGVASGSGKGLVALPDVDDLVLVLLIASDPAQGVVLGSLYGSEGPFDSGVVGASVKRYSLATPGGNRLRLDDDKGLLRLEDASGGSIEMADHAITLRDASGNAVELTPERVRIHSEADLVIEAPGHDVRIVGRAVDFETG
jgi:phage baseplate assembly protein gpV